MSFSSEASKLLTNKYFLYFMVFLAVTNVLGYLVTNKLNAVIFFALVSLLTYQFSKNMAVVLLVGVIATNFLMANRRMREGLENESDSTSNSDSATTTQPSSTTPTTTSTAVERVADIQPDMKDVINAVKAAKSNDEVKEKLKTTATENATNATIDMNNPDLNVTNDDSGIQGVGEKVLNNKKAALREHYGPRLDYAATIEQSYQNLDQLLGSDSIKQLTSDTQKLMQQQQNLFNTMNQMVPVLNSAKSMLSNFDISGLTSSLKDIGKVNNAPVAV